MIVINMDQIVQITVKIAVHAKDQVYLESPKYRRIGIEIQSFGPKQNFIFNQGIR